MRGNYYFADMRIKLPMEGNDKIEMVKKIMKIRNVVDGKDRITEDGGLVTLCPCCQQPVSASEET